MAGVLSVAEDRPRPGVVTVRVVAGHGDRIRRAALAIVPEGLEVRVLEDDLVTTSPELPPPTDPRALAATGPAPGRAGGQPGPAVPVGDLRCSYVFCRHRPAAEDFGLRDGDRCRQKIRVTNGWLSCPGHLRSVPAPRRRRWGRRR